MEQKMMYYEIAAVTILIAVLIIKMIGLLQFQKKVAAIMRILLVEKDADRCIQEIEKLLEETKQERYKAFLTVNLSLGYVEKGDGDKAYELLSSVDPYVLLGLNHAIYFNNLANYSFKRDRDNEGIKIMEDKEELFRKYEKHPVLGGGIAINKVYQYLAGKNIDKAKEYLAKAEKFCQNNHLRDEMEYVKACTEIQENRLVEAREVIGNLKGRKLTPGLTNRVKKLEEVTLES